MQPKRFEPLSVYDSGGFPTLNNTDSVASGTFGHLVRAVNDDTPEGKKMDKVVRYNLLNVKPKPGLSSDPIEAWREHRF